MKSFLNWLFFIENVTKNNSGMIFLPRIVSDKTSAINCDVNNTVTACATG